MGLPEELDRVRAGFEATAPPDAVRLIRDAVDALRRSRAMDRVPRVGDPAPALALADAFGRIVRLENLLAEGPLVLSFFRGAW